MKRILFLALVTAASAYALPPVASFTGITPDGANTNLNFVIDGTRHTLVDDDGVATLAALQYLLIQNHSDAIFGGNAKWDEVKSRTIPPQAIPILVKQMERAYEFYTENARRANGATKAALLKGAADLRPLIVSWSTKGSLTYEELNQLGGWLDRNASRHSYEVASTPKGGRTTTRTQRLIDNNSNNPVGTSLSGRGFTLPTTLMSRSRASFDVDLIAVFRNFQRLSNNGAGRPPSSAPPSGGTPPRNQGGSDVSFTPEPETHL